MESNYTREDSRAIRHIVDMLREHNVPFTERNHDYIGLQLLFPWANGGDVVCHGGTYHMPESFGFPWDDDDVTRDDPESMAARIIQLYNEQNRKRKFNVHIEVDMQVYAEDEHEAITLTLASIDDSDAEVKEIDPRKEWIESWYNRAMRAIDELGLYNLQYCKDVTILVERNPFPEITTSAPRHGDKYDRKTGIAVCYAKMKGEKVPDYI